MLLLLAAAPLSLAVLSILAAAAGASRPQTAYRRHLRTAQACWWCTARTHNSAVSESCTGPKVHRGVTGPTVPTKRGHAPPSSNLHRGTAWHAPLGQRLWHPAAHGMILAHAHKRALHAHGAWCGEARAGCGTQRGHAPHGRILHRGTAWQRALPAKTGTRQHGSSHRHAHTMRTCTRLAPGALCAVRRPVLTGTLSLAQRD